MLIAAAGEVTGARPPTSAADTNSTRDRAEARPSFACKVGCPDAGTLNEQSHERMFTVARDAQLKGNCGLK